MTPRTATLFAFLALVSLFGNSCASRPEKAARLEVQRIKLQAIKPETTDHEVLRILGKPSEERTATNSRLENEAFRWAYGAADKGGFASVGLVIFTTNKTVIETYCPTKPKHYRPAAGLVPITETPERTEAGVYCIVTSIEGRRFAPGTPVDITDSLSHRLNYSVVNDGANPFIFTQETAWVKFNLVVEVFDARRNLVLRQDYKHYASPSSRSEKDWTKIQVAPGGRVNEDFPIWLTDVDYGKPLPGNYFVRLLFPFEDRRFYSSNLKEFTVAK